jgi:Flp pilus assembly protein TadD
MAIAEEFGARVARIEWRDDFAAARNQSIALAAGDWLLHMDADEELDPEGAARIRALVDADGEGHDAVELTLANYSDDVRAWRWTPAEAGSPYARGRSGYLAVGLLRLFRNHRGFEYREPVHENITASVIENSGRILRAPDIVIHHHGYACEPARAEAKALRYLGIARRKMAERPGDVKALHDFAEQALARGLADEAEDACRKALAIDAAHLGAATTLANILLNRGDLAEARSLLERLEHIGLAAPHVVAALAAIALRDGRIAEAETRLRSVLAEQPKHPMARLYLARMHDLRGEPQHALRELELLRDLAPGIKEFNDLVRAHQLRDQGGRLFQTGYTSQALETLVEALRLDPENPMLHNDIGVVLHAMGERDRAKASFQRALTLAPTLEDARVNLGIDSGSR